MSGENETVLVRKGILPMLVSELCNLLGEECSLHGVHPETSFHAIVVADNMPVTKGCLFIPYQESDDYLVNVVSKGAAAVVTDHVIENTPCILVSDLTNTIYRLCELFASVVNLPSCI